MGDNAMTTRIVPMIAGVLLSASVYAEGGISGIEIQSASVQAGTEATMVIQGDDQSTYCGLTVDFGDGEIRNVQISEKDGKFPRRITKTYEKAGAYPIIADGKFLATAFPPFLPCAGKATAAITVTAGGGDAEVASRSAAGENRSAGKDGRGLNVTRTNGNGRRVALVIGNSNYQYPDSLPKLANPSHDAEDIAKALRGFGFDVIEKKNLGKEEMDDVIAEFSRKIGNSEAALFYFAGHGIQVKGQNYLMPVDAKIESEGQVAYKGVNVNQVLDEMDGAQSRANIVMLDACRNNPITGKFRSAATHGLAAPASTPKGTVIVYATDPGNTAMDGDGRNGLFTSGLLEAFKGGDLSLHGVLSRTSKAVEQGSDGKQTPYVNGPMTLQDDFHFGQGAQVASLEPVPVHVKTKDEIEDDDWHAAEQAHTADAVKAYLSAYPKGRYAGRAKMLVTSLKAEASKPAAAEEPVPAVREESPETALWNEAQKGNSKEDYQAYLDQYPKGKYAALAKSRIKKLHEEAQAALEKQEQDSWQAAGDENSVESYGRYLQGYPNGRYAGLAKARQLKLRNDQAALAEADLWRQAETENSREAVEAYLNQYPSGRYAAAAGMKLKALKEAAMSPAMVKIPGTNIDMGKYLVTRGEFAKFVQETGYDTGNSCWLSPEGKWEKRTGNNWRNPGFSQEDNHPVVCVNWDDAEAYVAWLSKKTGRNYKLPTESEWEAACYAGNRTEYCGGNDIESVAWYYNNSGRATHPVGQKQANGYGLYDMNGNAWEWMENWYDGTHNERALRGGSWNNVPQNVLSAFRDHDKSEFRLYCSGFRVARTRQ